MSRFSKVAPKQAVQSGHDLDIGMNQADIGKAREAQLDADRIAAEEAEQQRAFEALRRKRERAMKAALDEAEHAPVVGIEAVPAVEPLKPAEPKPIQGGDVAAKPVPEAPATEPPADQPVPPATGPDAFSVAAGRLKIALPPMPLMEEASTPQIVMGAFRELKRTDPDFHEQLRVAAGDFATSAMTEIAGKNPGSDMSSPAAASFRQNMGLAFAAGGMSLLAENGARTTFNDPDMDRLMAGHMERFADRYPDLYRKSEARPAAEWNEAGAVPLDMIRPDSPGEGSAHRAYYAGDAVISNGDAPVATLDPELSQVVPPPPPAPDNSFAAKFPPAPKGWPKMQAWPQQPAYDLMKENNAGEKEIEEYMKFIMARNDKMSRRADQIRDYLLEHNDPAKMQRFGGGYAHFRRAGKEASNQRDVRKYGDDHHGIKWAMLLNDNVKANALNITASWGFNTAATTDGGIVVARDDAIKFQKISKQAIQLAMHEGMARGWGSFNMSGNKEFCQEAIAVARSMNMPAKITERYGPFGLRSRVHHITPAPPGSDEAPKQEVEDLGTGENRSMTRLKDGTDLREAGGIAAPRPDAPKAAGKKRRKPDPDLDRPELDPVEPFDGADPRMLVEEDPEAETHLQMVNTGTPRPRTAADTNAFYDLG